ncbi:MAG: hypothetical protein Q7K16_01810 [Candidatus Azambacteria bacterium]|nr:hypothetical protein [Candidatus Azambacteria bacterium]
MVEIPSSSQTSPELSGPSLPQAIRFFSPRQKKGLIVSSIIFLTIVVFGGVGFYFWLTSFKKSQVDFGVSGPAQAASGEPVSYSVSYWNNTKQILQNAVLTIRYPKNSITSNGKAIQNIDLGNIGIGGGGKQEINLAFIGTDKSIQKLEVSLSYKPQNTSSTFENESTKDVAIYGSALFIDFKTPESVLPNIKNNYTIHYKNNTEHVFKNAVIEMGYPSEFNFISSDKLPAKNNNSWNLGDLNPNEEGDIIVSGILKNVTNVQFNLAIGISQDGKFFKFLETLSQINLSASPLRLDIFVNNEASITANLGDSLQFKISYENNTGVALSDIVLKANLDGLMYDFSTLKTDGFYNSVTNVIVWNAANQPQFKNLSPNESGEVSFYVNVRPRYVIRTFRDKNFLLQVLATMETLTIPPSLAVKSLSATSDIAIKVNTAADLKAKGYYYDSVLKNSGPIPPRANQTTTFTIHWLVTNYSNDLDKVVVTATLPEGVKWLNKKSGAGSALLEFNERTNELTWNIGKVQAATGVLLDPYEAIFQLSLTPSVTKIGSVVPVINDAILSGNDLFTGNQLSAIAPAVKTDMPDDPGVGTLKSRVQP